MGNTSFNGLSQIHGSSQNLISPPLPTSPLNSWLKFTSPTRTFEIVFTMLFQTLDIDLQTGMGDQHLGEPWIASIALLHKLPVSFLYRHTHLEKSLVRDHFDMAAGKFSGSWDNLDGLISVDEREERQRLSGMLADQGLSNRRDSWKWLGKGSRGFSVKAVKEFLMSGKDYSNRFIFKWSKWVTRKCNILMWRMALNRLPTSDQLRSRNCFFGSPECSLCGEADETADHIFSSCEIAVDVWNRVGRWCKLSPPFLFSRLDIFELHKEKGLDRSRREVIKGILFTTCWCLWLARNRKRFDNATFDGRKIFHDIKSLSFLWFRNRSRNCNIDWKDWFSFNLL